MRRIAVCVFKLKRTRANGISHTIASLSIRIPDENRPRVRILALAQFLNATRATIRHFHQLVPRFTVEAGVQFVIIIELALQMSK